MTITEAVERIKNFLASDIPEAYVTSDIGESSLEKRLPFVALDIDETEIKNSGNKIPYGASVKFTVLCAVRGKGKSAFERKSEAETLARKAVSSFLAHINEITVTAKSFSFQEFLIGSTETSAVGIDCEIYIKYE